MKKTGLYGFFALLLLIASVGIGALVGYASSMAVLVFGLQEYGDYIMGGIFIFASIVIFMANISKLDELTAKKTKESDEIPRNYFKDGDFSTK